MKFGQEQFLLLVLCRWEWTELLGGTHYCKDDETREVVCIARLRFTLAWQVISAWGLR